MMNTIQKCLARLMVGVRVNRAWSGTWSEDPVHFKRRRLGGSLTVWLGNLFLRLADSNIEMFVHSSEWAAWEKECYATLYPGLPPVAELPDGCLILPALPGVSLRRLRQDEFTAERIAAVAKELMRTHQLHCSYFRGGWSHGDLHLDNVLLDVTTGQVHLIDFDTRHVRCLSHTRRCAEDLLVFLLDLITAETWDWQLLTKTFLQEYDDKDILHALRDQLVVPTGLRKILWLTRTNLRDDSTVKSRLEILQGFICQFVDEQS